MLHVNTKIHVINSNYQIMLLHATHTVTLHPVSLLQGVQNVATLHGKTQFRLQT